MRNALSLTVFITVIAILWTIDIAYGHYKVKQLEAAERVEQYESELMRQCKLSFPNSPGNQQACFEEGML